MALERVAFPLFACAAFAGAFLLFSVQPLLAKWLLPALGGNPATWASCLVFYQGLLAFGYALAHLGAGSRRQRGAYAAFALAALGAAAWNQRLTAASEHVPPGALESALVFHVVALLFAQVGLPYLLLSSVSPLVTRWAGALPAEKVYRLYAISNAGSLGALLAYPALIEPSTTIAAQWRVFSYATAALGALMFGLALTRGTPQPSAADPGAEPPSPGLRLRWVGYAALPSALLLATTNYLTTDVAAVPLLWVVPLSLYLLTFIVAFGGAGRRASRVVLGVFVLASAGTAWNAFAQGTAPLWRQLTMSLATLASASLLCHLELVRLRPSVARSTEFYVWIAIGGSAGSIFVALIAPWMFADYYELELAVLATYVALLVRTRAPASPPSEFDGVRVRRSWERSLIWLAFGLCAPLLLWSLWLRVHGGAFEGETIERRRSFLGALRVTQLSVGRVLTHGRIRHGLQLGAPELRHLPTMYYGPGTAIARTFERHRAGQPRRIGVIGLGTGTIAALGSSLDRLRFYELDAQVVEVARSFFTFLRDSPARIETSIGDGRLGLARDPSSRFDILVLDAFSSDAVPVHLLTLEAFQLYLRRLAPDGVLLANVANRHLALDRVVRGAARAHGLPSAVVETPADAARFVSRVRWAVMARRGEQVSSLIDGMELTSDPLPPVVWTDDHASLWPVFR